MTGFAQIRRPARAYVAAVVLAGTVAVAQSIHRLLLDPPGTQWLVIALLTLLTGSFSVKVASINARISVSEAFVFVAVLLFGAPAGTITVLLEALTVIFWMTPGGQPSHRLLFNLAAPAVALWVSATIFFLFPGVQPYSRHPIPLPELLLPLTAFTALYFLLNSWLVAIVVGLETQQSALRIWWTKFTWLSVNYFSGASVAALIVTYLRDMAPSSLLIIVPLLILSYVNFQTAMGRVEDSNKHLSEVNRLHLSTIETLAMAIDAKDQITHGHIRRVQWYAVGLARHLGITDQKLIKAIEAAALLHDLGKLAVPEYILNKPGKLTSAEFEKMKLHANVGADILCAVDFPYPVVPIVRHHHENWDGTGYPSGLKGTDIPIGARILSVVDCFDALTSDRPYRPRLAEAEALEILFERSGSMYDPLIVDTFGRVHTEISPTISDAPLAPGALHEIGDLTRGQGLAASPSPLDDIAASSDERLAFSELAGALARQASLPDTGDIIARHLRRMIPFALSVLYVYDEATDELVAKHAIGDLVNITTELRVPLGQRLSGWVAANRQTIINSDPMLDLGEAARTFSPRLRNCLSTPLVSNDQLVGVLSLHSSRSEGFSGDHRRIIEAAARQVAHAVKAAAEIDRATRRDPLAASRRSLTGLSNAR
jgi:putative nucleotidyltransferase with HDIG domain